jgi:hypothetical protein
VLEVYEPANLPGKLTPVGASMSDDWNNVVANQTVNALWRASCAFRPSPSECSSCARAGPPLVRRMNSANHPRRDEAGFHHQRLCGRNLLARERRDVGSMGHDQKIPALPCADHR